MLRRENLASAGISYFLNVLEMVGRLKILDEKGDIAILINNGSLDNSFRQQSPKPITSLLVSERS